MSSFRRELAAISLIVIGVVSMFAVPLLVIAVAFAMGAEGLGWLIAAALGGMVPGGIIMGVCNLIAFRIDG